MSEGQWKRWDAVARLTAGKLTVGEAARVLGLSVRQVRRIRWRVVRACGHEQALPRCERLEPSGECRERVGQRARLIVVSQEHP